MADRSETLERLARPAPQRQPRSSAALWLILLLIVSGVLGWQTRAHWRVLLTGNDESNRASGSDMSSASEMPAAALSPSAAKATNATSPVVPAVVNAQQTASALPVVGTTAALAGPASPPTPQTIGVPAASVTATGANAASVALTTVQAAPTISPTVSATVSPSVANETAVQDARYLVRSAQLRISVERDARGALTMLEQAGVLLRDDARAEQLPLRAAIAADIAALRPVAQLDTELIYARLAALDARWDALPLAQSKLQGVAQPAAPTSGAPDVSWGGYAQGLGAYLQTLVRVRSDRGVGVAPVLDPAQGELLRQALHLLSLRAELALLRAQQSTYLQSLTSARQLLEQRFLTTDRSVVQARAELVALARLDIALPPVRLSAIGLLPAGPLPIAPIAPIAPAGSIAPTAPLTSSAGASPSTGVNVAAAPVGSVR